jgi:hypothetical protein
MEGMRTDRLSLLVDQLDRAREIAEVRLTGLGDEEYLWEPAPGAWSIRRRCEAASSRPFGPGEWVLDGGDPEIPAAEYAEIDRQVRGGMTVAKVATDWGVSHERARRSSTGSAPGAGPGAGHHDRVAAGPPAFRLRGPLGVDLWGAAAAA